MSCGDIFLGVIAILFPPIAGTYSPYLVLFLPSLTRSNFKTNFRILTSSPPVWIKSGICSADSLINILLCMLGYFPGLLHAWYIISIHPERDHDYEPIPDAENQNGRVTYYYIRHEAPSRGGNMNYGTQRQANPQQQGPPVPQGSRPAPAATVQGPSSGAGGEGEGAPPSYSEVVKGDNKIQSHD